MGCRAGRHGTPRCPTWDLTVSHDVPQDSMGRLTGTRREISRDTVGYREISWDVQREPAKKPNTKRIGPALPLVYTHRDVFGVTVSVLLARERRHFDTSIGEASGRYVYSARSRDIQRGPTGRPTGTPPQKPDKAGMLCAVSTLYVLAVKPYIRTARDSATYRGVPRDVQRGPPPKARYKADMLCAVSNLYVLAVTPSPYVRVLCLRRRHSDTIVVEHQAAIQHRATTLLFRNRGFELRCAR